MASKKTMEVNPKHSIMKELKEKFSAEEFDGHKIAQLAKAAGIKYITLTSRHHDGFSLYDTKGLSDHDAPHSAAGRDLVAGNTICYPTFFLREEVG